MNLRQHKRRLVARLHWVIVEAYWQRKIDECLKHTPEELAEQVARNEAFWADLSAKMSQRFLVESDPEVEAFKVEYVVAKKSTGEVVGTFDHKDDAEAMIEKARKAKKATLVLV